MGTFDLRQYPQNLGSPGLPEEKSHVHSKFQIILKFPLFDYLSLAICPLTCNQEVSVAVSASVVVVAAAVVVELVAALAAAQVVLGSFVPSWAAA